MNGVFSIDVLRTLMRDMRSLTHAPSRNPFFEPFGFPVRPSEAFPFISSCKRCGGTGSGGDEATYCQHCKGGGQIKHEGVIVEQAPTVSMFGPEPKVDGGKMTVLVSYFPRRFEPSFPFALPERPWPGMRLA